MTSRQALAAFTLVLLGAAPVFLLAALPAEAGFLRRKPERDVAVAVSRFGNGTVTGPVRPTSTGYEVRLPSGSWVACRRSCSETLRVETVDLTENDGSLTGYGTAANECGIFGCLDIRYPR
ncbi:hypothetical protein [Hyphomicrobium sp. LHD-15]|uniref:hypothetical protein n=1 Tax=Hyphomicrobium sp. LHD-15 TaxID=3072142 RepID=UPI00280EEFBD|nr:hypothetical protein [Hyphomicrobium sp. LHD-15]MDQ8700144.1 hypothetical protein [Hyphomicrobium sp. LHD-15]